MNGFSSKVQNALPFKMTTTASEYIANLRPLSLEEKQAELLSARQKAFAAAALHEIDLTEYYLEAIAYLSLFEIAEERLDVIERRTVNFF